MKENWQYKKLGEVCEIERGGSPRPINEYLTDSPDGLNWIKIGDAIEGNKYISQTKEKIKREGLRKTRYVHKGDFILSNSMSFGKPYILEIDGCIHDGWLVIHDTNNTFNKSFLYFLLGNPNMYKEFQRLAVGGVVNNLNSQLVRNVIVPIPPISEQERIVAELDLLSGIIERQKQQLNELDTLAQSIFYYMFGDPITNEKNWEVKKLGEVTITPNKIENKQINSDLLVSFLPMEDVKIDSIYQIPKQSKKISDLTKGSYNYFSNQDVLLAKVTPCFENGKCCVVKNLINQIGFGSSELITFRCQESILPLYLYFYFHSPTFISNGIKNMSGTSGLRRIQKNYLHKVSISIPPIALQNQFAEKIEKIEKQKEAINKNIEETQKLFDYTMDKYFG